MKTLRFKPLMAGVAIALMVGFVSCEKAMDEPVARPENQSSGPFDLAKASDLRVLFCQTTWFGPPLNKTVTDCDCAGTGGNCLVTVDVVGMAAPVLEEFLDAINLREIPEFFNNQNYEPLFGDIPDFQRYVPGLQNGRITFTLLTDNVDAPFVALHDSKITITSDNAGSDAILVIPFKR